MIHWVYVAIDTILCKASSILPNLAYVTNQPNPRTVKAGHRGMMNLQGKGFGGSWSVGNGPMASYGGGWDSNQVTTSSGGHSFLTMGEYRSKALSVVKPHEELEPLEADHPLRRLIENPNPFDTYFDLEYELGMFEELCGVSYEWLVPNRWGVPCERWCLPSHWVWPRTGGSKYPDGGRSRPDYADYDPNQAVGDYTRYGAQYVDPKDPYADQLIQYYEVRPWGGMGSAGILRIPPNQVIMNRWPSPLNKIDGYSKLAASSQWIDSEESISKSRWSQFQNIARPEFWVELGAGYEDPDDNKIARLEAKFMAKIQGEFNYGRPVVTPPGAKITPLSFSPTEMAYFESENQIRDMILSTWRVPPAAVGIVAEMTYGSILSTLAGLCEGCINPRLVKRGLTRTKHLACRWDEKNRKVRLWYDDCTPANPEQVNADITLDIQGNAITLNEHRALRGRRPYEVGGDTPWVSGPGGLMPLPVTKNLDMQEMGNLVGQFVNSAGEEKPGKLEEGRERLGLPAPTPEEQGMQGEAAEDAKPHEGEDTQLPDIDNEEVKPVSGIAEPNGKPQKQWVVEYALPLKVKEPI